MRRLRSAAVAILVTFALASALGGIDLVRLRLALSSLGPLVPCLLLPFLFAVSLDTLGSAILLGRIPRPAGLRGLLCVRLMAEAVGQTLPTGALIADGLTPRLLWQQCGIPWSEGIANVAARKALLFAAQATFLALAAACWASAMAGRPRAVGVAVGALLVAALILLLLRVLWSQGARGSLVARLAQGARVLPSRVARLWVARRRVAWREIDLQLLRVMSRGPNERRVEYAFAAYCAMCLVESLEAYWFLRLLGSPLSLAEALPLESIVSWLRAAVFFIPAGLGVQDLGGVALLHAAGIPEAAGIGAGWALLRRAREAFWILVGYLLLARWRSGVPSS